MEREGLTRVERRAIGPCGCGEVSVSYAKNSRACPNCLKIEAWLEMRANAKTREEQLATQRLYNETRSDAWKLKQTPPPAPPPDAVVSVAGYAVYWWNKLGQMQRAI